MHPFRDYVAKQLGDLALVPMSPPRRLACVVVGTLLRRLN